MTMIGSCTRPSHDDVRARPLTAIVVGAALLTLGWAPGEPALSQSSLTTPLDRLIEQSSFGALTADIAAQDVFLDGRRLFTVTAPVESESSDSTSNRSPIEERVATIEANLHRIVRDGIDPDRLTVTSALDPQTGLPVIQVNGRHVVTITSTDRQFRGATHNALTQTIKEALVAAHQERQPEFLWHRSLLAGSIALGAVVLSLGLTRAKVRLKHTHQHQLSQFQSPAPELEDSASRTGETSLVAEGGSRQSDSSPNPDSTDSSRSTHQQQSSAISQLKFRYDLYRSALRLGYVVVWGGAALGIVGLFPYTRWLRVMALSTLSGQFLSLAIVGGVTYLVWRVSEVAIEQLFTTVANGHLLAADASPRLIQRVLTFAGVVKSTIFVGITGVGTLVGLATIGFNVLPVLAGAGIVGLAVSFGAQSLVKDIITGFFILLEDQYGVGDVVVIGSSAGFVERMNLRITQLRSADGNLISIPHSSVTVVENVSNHWSRVNLGIEVAYSTDLDRAIEVIGNVARRMSRERYWQDLIVEEPEVLGVDEFGESSIVIRVWIQTLPLKHYEVGREYRRRLKQAFDRAGISIPFPQRSIWFENTLHSERGDRQTYSDRQLSQQINE